MLGLAKRVRARILQASTSEVYGDPEVHPQACCSFSFSFSFSFFLFFATDFHAQTEDYWGKVNPIGVRSCYDEVFLHFVKWKVKLIRLPFTASFLRANALLSAYSSITTARTEYDAATPLFVSISPLTPLYFPLQVDIRVARIFNTYGPGMHPYDGRVVSNFIVQVDYRHTILILFLTFLSRPSLTRTLPFMAMEAKLGPFASCLISWMG